MSKSVGCTTTCRFKFPKYFSWSWNMWPWFPVRVPKAAAALHLSTHGLREQICTERPQVCVLEKCACAFGRASWSPLQTVHQSVTNKPELESVLEIVASFPGFRFHLSALRQGFRTFATWNLHSNILQKGDVCTWGRLLRMQRRPKSNSIFVCRFFECVT